MGIRLFFDFLLFRFFDGYSNSFSIFSFFDFFFFLGQCVAYQTKPTLRLVAKPIVGVCVYR